MPVQVGPGDCRVVDGWHFYSAGLNAVRNGDDGFGTAFNNAGQFVYTLTFTDGTIGLFMSEFETRCVADLDTNGVVNSADLAILLASWSDACSPVDLDGDGTVGPGDLAMLLNRWGACPEF